MNYLSNNLITLVSSLLWDTVLIYGKTGGNDI